MANELHADRREDLGAAGETPSPPVPGVAWALPTSVLIDGRRLSWRFCLDTAPPSPSPGLSGPALLEAFVGLADASDDAIADFARHHGVPERCEHLFAGQRHSHLVMCGSSCHLGDPGDERYGWISLDSWRRMAAQLAAALSIAASLHNGRVPEVETWAALVDPDVVDRLRARPGSAHAEKDLLAQQFTRWLDVTRVRPRVNWALPETHPSLAFEPRGLLGAMVWEATMAAARADGVQPCSSCGRPTIVGCCRSPRRRAYCPSCRQAGRPQLDATRAWRARKLAATHTEVSSPAIADTTVSSRRKQDR